MSEMAGMHMLLWEQEETITRDWRGYPKGFSHEDVASEPGVLQADRAMVRREELGCFSDSGNSDHKGTGARKRKLRECTCSNDNFMTSNYAYPQTLYLK